MKKILLFLVFVLLENTVQAYTAEEYAGMSRQQLLRELLREKQEHQETRHALELALIAQRQITNIAINYRNAISALTEENGRLARLLDTPYHSGDMAFNMRAGVGSVIELEFSGQLFFTSHLYGYLSASAVSGYVWDLNWRYTRLVGTVGIGWSF